MTRVSGKMVTTGGNLTGIAKRLERGGLLWRKKDPLDERKTILEIRPEGRKKLNALKLEREKSAKKLLTSLSGKKKAELLEFLVSAQEKLSL
jgi:DNA-binding MarR family transcriptional regulator